MADRYWVGGSGNWDASSTANWSASSGGASGASAPTSADNVIFDANSNTGTSAFTVTVAAAVSCLNFTASGLDGVMTVESSVTNVALDVYGSMSLPATNLNWAPASGITLTFRGTSSNTITTNGVTLNTTSLLIDAVGGTLTLGSALTLNSTRGVGITNGTFSTSASNYTLSVGTLSSSNSNTRTINLNASAVTLNSSTAISISTITNLTFNAGTSTITCSNASPTFNGGGLTYYNVTFSSAGNGTATINGANTFSNNLTFTSRSATGVRQIIFAANQTVSATLTFGTANTAIRRMSVYGTTNTGTGVGTPVTLTVATLATLADVDFRDITAAGASGTWSGTRIGNGGGNSNITFTAGGPKYWNLAAGGNWSATAWATSSGGSVDVNNFPLAQDTVYIVDTGLTAGNTITTDTNWWLPTIDASARTTAFTLAGTSALVMYGSLTIPSVATVTNSANWYFGANNSTQNITTNGVSVSFALNCNGSTNNTVKLLDNFTTTSTVTLQQGTLDLNSKTLTGTTFTSSNSITRTIAFGTGNITVTGNAATIFTTSTATGFTVTGTPVLNATYSGSTGTRVINLGNAGEANAISVNVTAGTDQVNLSTTNGSFKNIDFTGFSGTMAFSNSINIFGNFTLSTGMTVGSGTQTPAFAATSGTQQITTNGKTIDYNLTVNAPGATVQLQDNLTLGSTRTFTLTSGTLDLSSGNRTLSTGIFSSSNSNTRAILFGTGQITVTGNNASVFDVATSTGFTYTGTSKIEFTYAGAVGTRNIRGGEPGAGGTESNSLNYLISAGSDIVTMGTNARRYRDINLTGFSGTFSNLQRTVYGSLTISSGTTVGAGVEVTTFAATSGTQNITSNGKTLDFPIIVNAPGATVQLQDALALGSTRTLTLTAGTLNANNQNCTTGLFASSNTNVRTLTMGSGTWTIQGAGTAWDASASTNLTVNGGTSTITMTSASAKTFAGGNKAYYILNQGGAGALTITGSNTFTTLSNTVQPTTVSFTNGTTQSIANFNLSGTAGNLVTINSTTPSSQFNLVKLTGSKAVVSYLSITDSAASPAGYWFSPTTQGNVDGGNNTGWNFGSAGLVSAFLIF